jgi:putative ABC transport system permease protein
MSLAATVACVALLTAVATTVLICYRVRGSWQAAAAVARGAAQLAVISVILSGVIRHPVSVAVALVAMFTAAVVTATARIGWSWARLAMTASAVGGGVAAVMLIVFATGAIELSARYALAIGGIVIGNAMTVASLTGRIFIDAVAKDWNEVEAWMAIGATPRQSTATITRFAVHQALIPSTDQTKTTGLVTLPGAFVGAIFGGLSPLEAGRFQIVVLASIMAAGSITAVIMAHWLAPVRLRPSLPG